MKSRSSVLIGWCSPVLSVNDRTYGVTVPVGPMLKTRPSTSKCWASFSLPARMVPAHGPYTAGLFGTVTTPSRCTWIELVETLGMHACVAPVVPGFRPGVPGSQIEASGMFGVPPAPMVLPSGFTCQTWPPWWSPKPVTTIRLPPNAQLRSTYKLPRSKSSPARTPGSFTQLLSPGSAASGAPGLFAAAPYVVPSDLTRTISPATPVPVNTSPTGNVWHAALGRTVAIFSSSSRPLRVENGVVARVDGSIRCRLNGWPVG